MRSVGVWLWVILLSFWWLSWYFYRHWEPIGHSNHYRISLRICIFYYRRLWKYVPISIENLHQWVYDLSIKVYRYLYLRVGELNQERRHHLDIDIWHNSHRWHRSDYQLVLKSGIYDDRVLVWCYLWLFISKCRFRS